MRACFCVCVSACVCGEGGLVVHSHQGSEDWMEDSALVHNRFFFLCMRQLLFTGPSVLS